MAEQANPDPYEFFKISPNPDGSLTRHDQYTLSPPTPTYDPNNPNPVLSKDVTFDPSNEDAWFRMYLPRQQQLQGAKLPVVFYFHGGGFIICRPDVEILHNFCSDIAAFVPAFVISCKYPLAPEHRLPAAYDHIMHALRWIKTNVSDIDWLRDHADFSNCFFMGGSAGGNMSYHVGLRSAAAAVDLEPIKIRGLILNHPGFGGVHKTPSELSIVNDPILPPFASDFVWGLALPVGADRDHEYSNPTAGGGSKDVEKMRALGYKVLVTGFEGDPLYDRQTAVAKMLENKGVTVETMFNEGGCHAYEFRDRSAAMQLQIVVKQFITSS